MTQVRRAALPKRDKLVIVFTVVFSLVALFTFQQRRHISLAAGQRPRASARIDRGSRQRQQIDDFWLDFRAHLRQANPSCKPIKSNRFCSIDSLRRPQWFEWLFTYGACNPADLTLYSGQHEKPRADRLSVDEEQVRALTKSHAYMVSISRNLAGHIPYVNNSSGIVMIGGGKYNMLVLLSLRMLRFSNSTLPVEVFLVADDEYDQSFCEDKLPSLNARCRLLTDTLGPDSSADQLSQYQYKVFAILFSSFENVFLLDADAFVAFNPDAVLTSEPFLSTGLITWPDLWAESSSRHFFRIAGLPSPPVQRYSTDSGCLLYSKRQQGASLLLATYYNYYGPRYYYALLSQGAHGQGDKETYLHAALALHTQFYSVKTPVWEIGTWTKEQSLRRVGMGQHYPTDDYWLSQKDMFATKRRIRPFLLHINNPNKLVPATIFRPWGPTWMGGRQVRLLGSAKDMLDTFGYDLEAVMWEQLQELTCQAGVACDQARTYVRTVFKSQRR